MATVALALLALYLVCVDPFLGRADHRRMLAAVGSGDPGARLRFYRRWTWLGWLLMLVTLAITLGIAGWTPHRIGLARPRWVGGIAPDSSSAMGFLAGIVIALVAGIVVGAVLQRRKRRGGRSLPGPALQPNPAVLALLPRTRPERWSFAALCVTAGITEEITWRGFGLTLLFALLPGVPPAVPIVIAAVAFGWAHFYQGLGGMLGTAVLGGVFAGLFWSTGSLLVPIVLHVLIDLRALMVRVPGDSVAGEKA